MSLYILRIIGAYILLKNYNYYYLSLALNLDYDNNDNGMGNPDKILLQINAQENLSLLEEQILQFSLLLYQS